MLIFVRVHNCCKPFTYAPWQVKRSLCTKWCICAKWSLCANEVEPLCELRGARQIFVQKVIIALCKRSGASVQTTWSTSDLFTESNHCVVQTKWSLCAKYVEHVRSLNRSNYCVVQTKWSLCANYVEHVRSLYIK